MTEMKQTMNTSLLEESQGAVLRAQEQEDFCAKSAPGYEAVLRAHERGFGFAELETGESHFVPPPLMKQHLSADRVRIRLGVNPRNGQVAVEELQLVHRPESFWLGELVQEPSGMLSFVPDEPVMPKLKLRGLKNARPGDVVQVRVAEGAPLGLSIGCDVVANLGPRNEREFDTQYAKAKWRLSQSWSEEALQEARQAATLPVQATSGVQDLRMLPFVTIDGESTKDFDDAVYVTEELELYVAIADVSRYVRTGGALDREARLRGTSVYFADEVVPMLPKELSNGMCSLNPGEDRYAVVVRMRIAEDGRVLHYRIERALIRSHARLTYQGVTDVCLGGASLQDIVGADAQLAVGDVLYNLTRLHQVMSAQRAQRGLMDMRHPEPRLDIQADGSYGLAWEQPTLAHELVEECMLLANRVAAAHLALNGEATLFRHHQGVDLDKWAETREWLVKEGIEAPERPTLAQLRELLGTYKDHAAASSIEWRVRRSFASAVYTPEESSHYSLDFLTYTHFTSPIRRYADLMVHRMLLGEDVEDVVAVAEQCSKLSRQANVASRWGMDRIKRRNLWQQTQGQPLVGQVATCAKRGVKVVVEGWDTVVWVPDASLAQASLQWDDAQECWKQGPTRLDLGVRVRVRPVELKQQAASLEVQADFVGFHD